MPDSATPEPIACQRSLFDLPRDIAYINSGDNPVRARTRNASRG